MPAENTINKSMTLHEWGLLIALSILWGGSFFFTGIAVKELPTFTIVVGRVVLAAISLLLVVRFMGLRMPNGLRIWRAFFAMGFLNNVVPFVLLQKFRCVHFSRPSHRPANSKVWNSLPGLLGAINTQIIFQSRERRVRALLKVSDTNYYNNKIRDELF